MDNESNTVQAEMPKYRCHKEVWALKISNIERDIDMAKEENRETDGSIILSFENKLFVPIKLDHKYAQKHKPEVGGYYVVYKDDYKSFSPAEAFEDGYMLIK